MAQTAREGNIFDDENIWRILFQIAPPVMLAQLIQALYNIVDSYFVGQYSEAGLTALSVIFPVQFVIIALAIGTGVGVNTYMARLYAYRRYEEADRTAGTGWCWRFSCGRCSRCFHWRPCGPTWRRRRSRRRPWRRP